MRAIIMAGGEGTRLRPITCNMPKPIVPICDKAVIIHIIELLEKHGINDIAITLKYLPKDIINTIKKASEENIINSDIKFCTETFALGTAGSVKNCIKECYGNIEEDYLIISGDAITDINITEMISFHKRKSKMATIAIKPIDEPTEFGIVLTNNESMITGFIEKPQWSEAVSNLANTGIYIVTPQLMELCREGSPCDFANDIFSKVEDLSNNIAAYVTNALWCDIGNIDSYKKINLETLAKIPQASIKEHYSQNCNISEKAIINNSFICHGCSVDDGSLIENSIIMSNSIIGKNCQIRDCIICRNVTIEDGVIADDAVIGEKTFIGHSAIIQNDTKIWNNINILPESIIHGTIKKKLNNNGALGSYSPDLILKLGSAFGTFLGHGASVLVCHDLCGSSAMIAACMQAALAYVGNSVKIIEPIPLSVIRWICRSGICDGAIYVSQNTESVVHLLNKFGDDLSKNERRKIKSIFETEEYSSVSKEDIRMCETLANPEDYYIAHIMDYFKCSHKNLNYIGRKFTKSQRYAVSCYMTIKMYKDSPIFLPAFDSLLAEKIAKKFDRYTIKCGCNSGDIMAEMEKFMHIDGVYAQYLMFFDDLAFDLALCCLDSYINEENDNIAENIINTPIFRSEWVVPIKESSKKLNKAEILKKFTNSEIAKKGFEIKDGIRLFDEKFAARVCAEDKKQGFHVYVESLSEEYAKEIAFDIINALENLLT